MSDMETFSEIPYGLPGKIYRSVMPFSNYDRGQIVYQRYMQHRVSCVVLLADDQECLEESGLNLRSFYNEQGLKVIYLPAMDKGVPDLAALEEAVNTVQTEAQAGFHVAVHCHAGIGRTGLFAACLAVQVFGYSPVETLQWVRKFIPGAVETDQQVKTVYNFARRVSKHRALEA
ncbi:MAG: hypothetical protein HPY45_02840 [Anaerolineae bacterium]|nr:hypothetical protein [Anaerolineae bacterium]